MAALAALCLPAHAQQDSLTRVTEFTYHPTTGLLETERVDPGGTHCAETAYKHDAYGNRERVTVRACGTATFTTRVAVNDFEAGSAYPVGAYLTRSRAGTEVSPGSGISTMAETRATFDARFGAPASATEVALGVAGGARDLTKRTTYDSLGRVSAQHMPVQRNADNTVAETRIEYQTVYCRGPKASGNSACMTHLHDQTVPVSYPSQRLVDASGAVTGTATIMLRSAYFVEATPRGAVGLVIGTRSRVHYDSLHREIAKESETYDGWTRTITGYDQLGLTAASWGPHYFIQGVGLLPQEQRQWVSERDLLHRPVAAAQFTKSSNGASSATQIEARTSYSGLTTTATIPPGSTPNGVARTRVTHKNAVGQVVQTVDPLSATVNMAYDGFGNLVRTLDALGFATSISYTATTARFKQSMTDPDKGTWQYSYDALGQLKSQTDGRGKTTTLDYDALGRMTAKNTDALNASWKYSTSNAGAVQCADGLPRLCESWTGNLPTPVTRRRLAYDSLGRASQSTETLDRDYVSSTTFDTLGRIDTFSYASALTLKYTYSNGTYPSGKAPGVLITVADNANAARQFWSIASVGNPFDARGNVLKAVLGNGVSTDHVYDAISGKAFVLRAGSGGANNNVLDQTFTYDKVNNLSARTNGFGGGSESFGYDALDRLTSYAIDSSVNSLDRTITASYNAIGNMLTKSDVGGYTYGGARPHAVSAAGGSSYTYDGNGNLLGSSGVQTRTLSWTDFNLPNTIAGSGTTLSFQYDEQYKRVKETFVAGGTERRLWLLHPNDAGGLAFEREESWSAGVMTRNENRHYIAVGGAVIGVVKTLSANTTGAALVGTVSTDANLTHYWHKDSLGSIVAVTNGAGTVIERPAFDAWGRRLLENRQIDASYSGPAHGNRGYTGHEHLDELKLVHMNGRIYDPVLARFLSPDPLIQSPHDLQNYNQYSYVLNNPLKYTDANGKWWQVIVFLIGAVMAHEGNQYWSMVGRALMIAALQGQGGLVDSGLGGVTSNGVACVPNAFSAGGVGNAVASAAVASAAAGGSTEDIMTSAIFAAGFHGAGGLAGSGGELTPSQFSMHVLLGCVQQSMGGGKCGPGALSAGFGKLTTANMPGGMGSAEAGLATAFAGGTASVIGGGKFANGAFQAAFAYLYNCIATQSGNCGDPNSNSEIEGRALRGGSGSLQVGFNASGHVAAMGLSGEVGFTFPLDRVDVCGYYKFCSTVGPGLAFGAGGTGGLSLGSATSGWQRSSGFSVTNIDALGGTWAGEFDASGTSASNSFAVRPQVGWGKAAGVTGCGGYQLCALDLRQQRDGP